MVGGARVFGPKPRDYWFKLNKKVKTLARKSALAYKAQANNIVVVEDFTFEAPKTKEFVNVVNNLKVAGKKLLMVLPEANKNVYLSARNLERYKSCNCFCAEYLLSIERRNSCCYRERIESYRGNLS